VTPENRRIPRPKPPPDVLLGTEATVRTRRRWSKLGGVLRAVFGVAVVVAFSVGVAWAARQHILTSPRFKVSDIVVSGDKHRTADELAAEAGIAKGQNVFSVDLERARARLLADPWISEATLARRLPGTLLVEVTEREAGAIVALTDSYLASREGEIFKRLEVGDPTDLPVITGLVPDQVADDREGVARTIRRALDLASDYEHGPLAERAPLQEIHLAPDGALSLVVGKDAIAIALGEPPFRKKLDQAARVIAELDRRGAKPDAIMLDNAARPERVVVRMR
jgi:cell division protein FtsQ